MTEESPPAEYSVVDDNDFALRFEQSACHFLGSFTLFQSSLTTLCLCRGRIGDMMVPTLFAGCENGRSYLFKEFIPATNGTDSILFGKRIVFLGDSTLHAVFRSLKSLFVCSSIVGTSSRCGRINYLGVSSQKSSELWIPESLRSEICKSSAGRYCPGGRACGRQWDWALWTLLDCSH